MASGQRAWWGKVDDVPSGQISFSWEGGLSGRRQIIGYSEKRLLHWHYGITPKPRVSPFLHVRLVSRVIFSKDGRTPIDNPKRMHRLRRSMTKSWRNAKWRDMLLAFLYWLSDGQKHFHVPVGSEVLLSLHLPPVIFSSPVSILLPEDDTKELNKDEDLDADGDDEINSDTFDYEEELLGTDDQDIGNDLAVGKERE